ncbi:MAG: hypothetical protein RLZZ455_508 [Candidatus Parcubacteria bacterium]|jgi:glycerol-3-phosphate cytidylyltransferase
MIDVAKKIITPKQAVSLSEELRKNHKRIVLCGGCFDILHIGHAIFLSHAKKQGDALFILLESDQAIKKLKGNNRPINSQDDRAMLLALLSITDSIILLNGVLHDNDYDELISALKPAIIATTKADPQRVHKVRQANSVGAKVIDVTELIRTNSTTKIAELLQREL